MAKIIEMENALEQSWKKQKKLMNIDGVIIIISLLLLLLTGGLSIVSLCLAVIHAASCNKQKEILESGLKGEKKVASKLAELPEAYTVIHNLQIKDRENRQSELDALVIGNGQIYLIEVKNHKGHISGLAKDQQWEQEVISGGGNSYSRTMKNPIKQSTRQMYILKDMLSQIGMNPYLKQIVVFANESAYLDLDRTRVPVLNGCDLLDYILRDSKHTLCLDNSESKLIKYLTDAA